MWKYHGLRFVIYPENLRIETHSLQSFPKTCVREFLILKKSTNLGRVWSVNLGASTLARVDIAYVDIDLKLTKGFALWMWHWTFRFHKSEITLMRFARFVNFSKLRHIKFKIWWRLFFSMLWVLHNIGNITVLLLFGIIIRARDVIDFCFSTSAQLNN